MRGDKLMQHQEASHARALARYTRQYGPLDAKDEPPPTGTPQLTGAASIEQVAPPLANLVRTVVTVALSKSALRIVPILVELQRANEVAILELKGDGEGGVQSLLHAAAVVLQRRQNIRVRKAGMLSKMGDGSSDRKTTEQEIIYIRYPSAPRPITESLRGIRWTVEFRL